MSTSLSYLNFLTVIIYVGIIANNIFPVFDSTQSLLLQYPNKRQQFTVHVYIIINEKNRQIPGIF